MPSRQQGSLVRRARWWAARWYDADGVARLKSGFATKTEAAQFLRGDPSRGVAGELARVEALRRGDVAAVRRADMPTLAELVEEFLAQHNAEANTLRTLRARLRYATEGAALDGKGWKDVRIDRLDAAAIGGWRKRLPERSAYAIHKALRQALHYAVRVKLVDENVACAVPNPEPKRREVPVFESVDELEAVAAKLPAQWAPIPLLVGLTGLRPEEFLALERRDVAGDVVYVRRVFTDGRAKPYGKQSGSLRAVPLPLRAAEAVAALPARLDTPLLFPAERGASGERYCGRCVGRGGQPIRCQHLTLANWRRREWADALAAAKLPYRSPYSLRHSYAAFAIAAGVQLFELARFMGTSVEQIDETYGHPLPDSLDRTRAALNAFVASAAVDVEGLRT